MRSSKWYLNVALNIFHLFDPSFYKGRTFHIKNRLIGKDDHWSPIHISQKARAIQGLQWGSENDLLLFARANQILLHSQVLSTSVFTVTTCYVWVYNKEDVQIDKISELGEILVITDQVISNPHYISQTPGKFGERFFLRELIIQFLWCGPGEARKIIILNHSWWF